jgi:ribulose kinase
VDRFNDEEIPVKGLIGLGGVAKRSPFIMQMMADVMNMSIEFTNQNKPALQVQRCLRQLLRYLSKS